MAMIQSMTGYGKAEAVLDTGKITVEIRTLNGKNADVSVKTGLLPRDRELLVRRKIADTLHRGTIDLFVNYVPGETSGAKTINASLVKDYYAQLSAIRSSLPGFAGAEPGSSAGTCDELLAAILRFPDVMDAGKEDLINESNWPLVERALDECLRAVCEYREKEGAALYADVTSRVQRILSLEDEVEAHEAQRLESVKARILKNAEETGIKLDPERFEQEMVFYLEKLDINEEKVRLRQHCRYFMDTIDSDPFPGKKLGFIIQEMGREINTTGSKANNAAIQKAVVRMKDELEKIREQSMNIL